jgi:hypothetical protein
MVTHACYPSYLEKHKWEDEGAGSPGCKVTLSQKLLMQKGLAE